MIQNVLDEYAQKRKGTGWAVVVFNKTQQAIIETLIDFVKEVLAE